MATRWVGQSARGSGDGSSRGNAAAASALNAQIALAALSAPAQVRLLAEDTLIAADVTLTAGGSQAIPVDVTGWGLDDAVRPVKVSGSRTFPYQAPAPTAYDQYVPNADNGSDGEHTWRIDDGCNWVKFRNIEPVGVKTLFLLVGLVTMFQFEDVHGLGCQRIFDSTDSSDANPVGILGISDAQRATFQRFSCLGHSRELFRINGSQYLLIQNFVIDSQSQMYDGAAAGIAVNGSSSRTASFNVIIRRFRISNEQGRDYLTHAARWQLNHGSPAPSGGTFTLTYDDGAPHTTAPINFGAAGSAIKSALIAAAPAALTTRNVFVSGDMATVNGQKVNFGANFLTTAPGTLSINTGGLTGGTIILAQIQSYAFVDPAYTQGDCIRWEEFDRMILVDRGVMNGCGDGGIDAKGSDGVFMRTQVTGAKRSVRSHPGSPVNEKNGVTCIQLKGINPARSVYGGGEPLAGTATLAAQAQLQLNGPVISGFECQFTNDGSGDFSDPGNSQCNLLEGSNQLRAVSIVSGGTGYPSGPNTLLSGGGGLGGGILRAVVNRESGTITSCVVEAPGDYDTPPTISFVVPFGPGAGATAHCVLTGRLITSVVMDAPGALYRKGPDAIITGGTGATITLGATNGVINDADLIQAGSGFSVSVTVTADNALGGSGAALVGYILESQMHLSNSWIKRPTATNRTTFSDTVATNYSECNVMETLT